MSRAMLRGLARLGALVALLSLAGAPPAVAGARSSALRPAFGRDFPDPMVLRVGKSYFAYGTAAGWEHRGRAFPILFSRDLRHWRFVGDALDKLPGWSVDGYWAPSVLLRNGTYYLFYTARQRRDGQHCLAVATASSPTGPFQPRLGAPLACGDRAVGNGYFDPAPLVDVDGTVYLYFAVGRPQHLIAALPLRSDLLAPAGPRVDVLAIDQPWQLGLASPTLEAPYPVLRNGRYYLFYSVGDWRTDYRMGYAIGAGPAGPFEDSGINPILRPRPLAAPGGGSVFDTPAGDQLLAFHAWSGAVGYENGGRRTLRVARLTGQDNAVVVDVPGMTRGGSGASR